ncbi:unnamed protein product [Paramecium sonneborni]|uniref:Uncharacterized protein n=1 Tax=Paramecium sonneborni TaxID=65129 RepID=A0A8S1RP00_9CILI|nr:unnamed protein product [Paramecium sonneborni]
MKLLFLLLLLGSSDLQNFYAADAYAKCSENDVYILRERSNIRGHYKDVASESNGAIISTARINKFIGSAFLASPLRNSIYYFQNLINNVGHIFAELHESVIIELLQAYELNRVRFRMWDYDDRITDIQIFVIGQDRITETEIFNGLAKDVMNIKFPDQLVSKIKFYNKNGANTATRRLSVIKIQAFYVF